MSLFGTFLRMNDETKWKTLPESTLNKRSKTVKTNVNPA